MIGNKYNRQKGQVLLITVMLLATILTVVLSVSFKSTTETQVTKLEEEVQKALAAAEAGIEAALRNGTTVADISTLPNLSGFTGSATVSTETKSEFVTPLLQKDEQYTFYLTNYAYDKSTKTQTFSGAYSGDLEIYFGQNSNCPTLELTILKSDGSVIKRKLAIPDCDTTTEGPTNDPLVTTSAGSYNVEGVVFDNFATLSSLDLSGNDILIIRNLSSLGSSSATKIGIVSDGSDLSLEGKTINSEARSSTGVTKKIQLFQSYPQIPAEFFVTSF